MSFKKIALFILLAVSPIITKLVYVYATGNPVRGWSQMGIWYAAFLFFGVKYYLRSQRSSK